jgi:hypothetical protein
LKRNNDATASNKDLSENVSGNPVETKCDSSDDEIVQECRATAEDTYLKGPSAVNDHDALEVAVEDQHKALEKISESRRRENLKSYSGSYECEPKKNVH